MKLDEDVSFGVEGGVSADEIAPAGAAGLIRANSEFAVSHPFRKMREMYGPPVEVCKAAVDLASF